MSLLLLNYVVFLNMVLVSTFSISSAIKNILTVISVFGLRDSVVGKFNSSLHSMKTTEVNIII